MGRLFTLIFTSESKWYCQYFGVDFDLKRHSILQLDHFEYIIRPTRLCAQVLVLVHNSQDYRANQDIFS